MKRSELECMLTEDKYDNILQMYHFFSRVPTGQSEMIRFIRKYILATGSKMNQEANYELNMCSSSRPIAVSWVQQILKLQDKTDKILAQAVNNDKSFQIAFSEAFEIFINENWKSAEFISLFIDEILKKGLKGKLEHEIEDTLDKTIMVFRYLKNKDMFVRFYKQHLGKRLLLNKSVSDDAERGILSKLKRECGCQFTNKLEGMFKDMKLSVDMNNQFKDYLSTTNQKFPFEFYVTTLTSTFWPFPSSPQVCVLPPMLLKARDSFENFYLNRHSGRRLTWQPQMGTADVRGCFSKSNHSLNVSTYAMTILLLFNQHDTLYFKEIKTMTRIADADLKRALYSLACAKYKILLKSSAKNREVQDSDSFSFNPNFTCHSARIKIQAGVSKVETDENIRDKVDEERKYQIEAAIVRVMKNRKKVEHNLLIVEVTRQLSFKFIPDPLMIKKRIEALIDREYLKRSTRDRCIYQYLA
ncbi:hypothetical protein G6F37_011174 [Rhizopus arrhizus]|nr:hypothetical protein G6F38_008646 [Rhizopus arrhizus]KAG1150548.1 hypothetical protein G6F37_011174 [Rhizopus arrhizus]